MVEPMLRRSILRLAVLAAVFGVLLSSGPGPVMADGISVDMAGDVGRYSSLALDSDGNPVVSYEGNALKVVHCNDPNCRGNDESIVVADTAGIHTSLALDSAGNPVVSYYYRTTDELRLLHCGNPTCSAGNSIVAVDTADDVGGHTSLVLDTSGNPVVSYFDVTNSDLKLLHCNDPDCTGGDESVTSPDTLDTVGRYTSLALDSSGNPVVSYEGATAGALKVLHCNDPDCTGGDESIESPTRALG